VALIKFGNIEPMPNPKPLRVERVSTSIGKSDNDAPTIVTGFVRNANLHPSAIASGQRGY
jgi:hypothetical protein